MGQLDGRTKITAPAEGLPGLPPPSDSGSSSSFASDASDSGYSSTSSEGSGSPHGTRSHQEKRHPARKESSKRKDGSPGLHESKQVKHEAKIDEHRRHRSPSPQQRSRSPTRQPFQNHGKRSASYSRSLSRDNRKRGRRSATYSRSPSPGHRQRGKQPAGYRRSRSPGDREPDVRGQSGKDGRLLKDGHSAREASNAGGFRDAVSQKKAPQPTAPHRVNGRVAVSAVLRKGVEKRRAEGIMQDGDKSEKQGTVEESEGSRVAQAMGREEKFAEEALREVSQPEEGEGPGMHSEALEKGEPDGSQPLEGGRKADGQDEHDGAGKAPGLAVVKLEEKHEKRISRWDKKEIGEVRESEHGFGSKNADQDARSDDRADDGTGSIKRTEKEQRNHDNRIRSDDARRGEERYGDEMRRGGRFESSRDDHERPRRDRYDDRRDERGSRYESERFRGGRYDDRRRDYGRAEEHRGRYEERARPSFREEWPEFGDRRRYEERGWERDRQPSVKRAPFERPESMQADREERARGRGFGVQRGWGVKQVADKWGHDKFNEVNEGQQAAVKEEEDPYVKIEALLAM